MSLKALGIQDMSQVDFIDRPDLKSLMAAFQTLIKLEAIDPSTAGLTQTGYDMSVMPTDPIYSKLLVKSLKP